MPELLSISTLIVCFITILCMVKFFGMEGLYVYSSVAVIASNIQVLKLTKYCFVNEPFALGTVLFSTTFAVDNILNEYFGEKFAKKSVWISFCIYLFFMITIKISILHPVVYHHECINMHMELKKLFSPTIVLFVSSLVSYLISQHTDIFIFSTLKKIFQKKHVSVRTIISMAISSFIDNFIFSTLAWVIFSDQPISMSSLWTTYIFITYIIRLVIAIMCVPLVKLAGNLIEKKAKANV